MSVRAYLIRVIDYTFDDQGYPYFKFEETGQEIFNVWRHQGIVQMIIDYGVDSTNADFCGLIEITTEGVESFKESAGYCKLSKEEVEIFNRIESELENSKLGVIQFECY